MEVNLSEHPDHACAGHQALTPRERARLSGILARLASPYDGERAAAAARINVVNVVGRVAAVNAWLHAVIHL